MQLRWLLAVPCILVQARRDTRQLNVDHPDTIDVNTCLSLFGQLPLATRLVLQSQGIVFEEVCLVGTVNLCTQDVSLNVTANGISQQIEYGDGTVSTAGAWVQLPEELLPGNICSNPELRVRNGVLALSGVRLCLDLRISCLPNPVNLACFELGDDVDSCSATDQCSCIQHPECGW